MADERYLAGIVTDIGDVGPIPAAALQGVQWDRYSDPLLGRPIRVESVSENRLVYLPDGPGFERALHVLQKLRSLQRMVLIEVQGVLIQTAKPTLVGLIVLGLEDEFGNYTIQLDCAPGRFVLFIDDFDDATYQRYRDVLVAAQASELVSVSLQPGGVRIDHVGEAKSRPNAPLPGCRPTAYAVNLVDEVSVGTADTVWAAITAESCAAGATADCLPYNYPENYCHARAHKVCQLFEAQNVSAGKVWLMGDLKIATKYHEDCSFGWAWHVAPFVRPEGEINEANFYVFDPTSDETGYRPLADWVASFGDARAAYKLTLADAYLGVCDAPGFLAGKCEGPGVTHLDSQSDDDIDFAILLLGEKSPQPPYNCP